MSTETVDSSTEPKLEERTEIAAELDSKKQNGSALEQSKKHTPIVMRDAPQVEDSPDALDRRGLSLQRRNVLTVIALQFIVLVLMYTTTYASSLAHGNGWPIPTAEEVANYDFVGVNPENPQPSALAIIMEVL